VFVTQTCPLGLDNFHIRTVQHLDIIKVLFIHQPLHQSFILKNNIKIYIKTYINVNFNIVILRQLTGASVGE